LINRCKDAKYDGFDLYKEIKKLDPIIKVCFITGFEVNYRALQEIFPELAQECYISKPTTMKELKEHVPSFITGIVLVIKLMTIGREQNSSFIYQVC
jgi:response regulator RpfG family c-di-GMP phosphodiesterase